MKVIIGLPLILCSICGLLISILGKTVVTSSMQILNGMEISLALGILSGFLFLTGLYLLTVD